MTSKMQVNAETLPTKQFFVSMLTRDISLSDAILDLVDNCLDGALRVAQGRDVDYSKHSIVLKCTNDSFIIEDDCGGIPKEIAQNYAFKIGRESGDERDSTTETIGMYGVGMKRAIFKMGRNAIVKTMYNKDSYFVPISSDWLDAKDWKPLPIVSIPTKESLKKPGTKIEVSKLYPGVSNHFTNGPFLDDLRSSLGEHFTLFIQRGLSITLNDKKIEPTIVELLVSKNEAGPAPYMFQQEIEGVRVTILIGLNTGRNYDEDNEPDFEMNRSSITAGWTVFCNDRAIIVGDKSRLTCWGDGIPMYHGQFSVITGIVEFRSVSASKLPITTTKRALDTTSDIWLQARTKMRDGLKIWIKHTNAWKNHPRSDQTELWKSSVPLQLESAIKSIMSRKTTEKRNGIIEYDPKKNGVLPSPHTKKPSSRRIIFSRPAEEIVEISKALFDDPDEKPGTVGDECFRIVLEKVRENKDE